MARQEMVRVGLRSEPTGPRYLIMHLQTGLDPVGIEVSEEQAADISHQIQQLLPEELLNVEKGFSDKLGEMANG